jgi:hypothetical protein
MADALGGNPASLVAAAFAPRFDNDRIGPPAQVVWQHSSFFKVANKSGVGRRSTLSVALVLSFIYQRAR